MFAHTNLSSYVLCACTRITFFFLLPLINFHFKFIRVSLRAIKNASHLSLLSPAKVMIYLDNYNTYVLLSARDFIPDLRTAIFYVRHVRSECTLHIPLVIKLIL